MSGHPVLVSDLETYEWFTYKIARRLDVKAGRVRRSVTDTSAAARRKKLEPRKRETENVKG